MPHCRLLPTTLLPLALALLVPALSLSAAENIEFFEGDGTLSIVLSKAFLLADDAKITDPSIVNQMILKQLIGG